MTPTRKERARGRRVRAAHEFLLYLVIAVLVVEEVRNLFLTDRVLSISTLCAQAVREQVDVLVAMKAEIIRLAEKP